MAPLVTVITATYNSSALLRLSLSSLISQKYDAFEAWIVGDACTDDSAAVVASFGDPRLHWTNLLRNSGSQAAPNNEGLARAQGGLIAFLGHDDLWFPWHLETLVARADATKAEFVHGLAAIFDRLGPCSASASPPPGLSYRDHGGPPSAWLIRREAAQRWGPWADPASLARAVDHEYLASGSSHRRGICVLAAAQRAEIPVAALRLLRTAHVATAAHVSRGDAGEPGPTRATDPLRAGDRFRTASAPDNRTGLRRSGVAQARVEGHAPATRHGPVARHTAPGRAPATPVPTDSPAAPARPRTRELEAGPLQS